MQCINIEDKFGGSGWSFLVVRSKRKHRNNRSRRVLHSSVLGEFGTTAMLFRPGDFGD